MVTEGTMTLQHEGHHSVHLAPFEQDKFEGAWTTRCMGRGRDFNLMFADGCSGELQAIQIPFNGCYQADLQCRQTGNEQAWILFYCVDGSLKLTCGGESTVLHPGDLLLVDCRNLNEHIELLFRCEDGPTAHVIRGKVSP